MAKNSVTVVVTEPFLKKFVTVVQTEPFLRQVNNFFANEDDLQELISFLANNPDAGVVAKEMNGCRKLRWPSKLKGSGKRGGYRVYFLNRSEYGEVWLLTIFTKTEKEDLSHREKKDLKKRT